MAVLAQAFRSVGYPILPYVDRQLGLDTRVPAAADELLEVRHHSLFAPRDVDLSPYFRIVKPLLEQGFDHRRLAWRRPVVISAGAPLADGAARR